MRELPAVAKGAEADDEDDADDGALQQRRPPVHLRHGLAEARRTEMLTHAFVGLAVIAVPALCEDHVQVLRAAVVEATARVAALLVGVPDKVLPDALRRR